MKRNKKKLVKFLETDQIKELEEPLIEKVKPIICKPKEKLTPSEKISIRDFALITLVYSCALRISEACDLKMQYIDLEKKTMMVIDGKGGDRFISIPEPAINILKKWLEIRPSWKDNEYFFTNVKGTTRPNKNGKANNTKHLTPKYYNVLFKKLSEETGIKLKDGSYVHPHTLRHSRAMEIYDNGVTLDVLQALLGHKNISTTQIYAEVRNEKVIAAQQNVVGGIVTI